MLEPRTATSGACSRIRLTMASASSKALGPKSPMERPWPRASYARAASPWAIAFRAKSKWLSFADPDPWQITMPADGAASGRKRAYASPSCVASSGRDGRGCFIIEADYGRERRAHRRVVPARGALAGLSDWDPPERGGAARGGRMRPRRAREGVRDAGVRLRGERHPGPGPRVRGRVPIPNRALRGRLREQGVPLHRGLPAARGRGARLRRRLG